MTAWTPCCIYRNMMTPVNKWALQVFFFLSSSLTGTLFSRLGTSRVLPIANRTSCQSAPFPLSAGFLIMFHQMLDTLFPCVTMPPHLVSA